MVTGYAEFEKVRQALVAANIELASADLAMIPSQTVASTGDNAEKLQKIVDLLEQNDDVQNVYTNADER